MRKSRSPLLALTACLLIAISTEIPAQSVIEPVWVEPRARLLAGSPRVTQRANALLDATLAGARADTLITSIEAIRRDASWPAPERDAVLSVYLDRLREHAPGTAPERVLDWLAGASPLAVIEHEEGAHHPVAAASISTAGT